MSGPAPLLLLFDIDGTLLLGATEAHAEALHVAMREVFGVDDARGVVVEYAGRTDGSIAFDLLRGAGVDAAEIAARGDELRAAWVRSHAELCADDLKATVLPGVRPLLDELAARDDVVLSLLTGNLEPIARRKLAAAGIGKYFAGDQGAFGSDHDERGALPDVARHRAGVDGSPHPRERTLIIGDTPRDILCARAGGVRVFGVATGRFGVAELSEADAVARDADELGALLDGALAGRDPSG